MPIKSTLAAIRPTAAERNAGLNPVTEAYARANVMSRAWGIPLGLTTAAPAERSERVEEDGVPVA